MKKIKAYVINLPQSKGRREYMEALLSKYDFLDVQFIDGIDGRKLTQEEVDKLFDAKEAYKRYGRYLERGEIGCVLSHYKCYEEIIRSNEPYAMIFEDDISILKEFVITDAMRQILSSRKPTALMFSGDYWYIKKKKLDECREIATVYDCVGAYAYCINNKAAKLLLNKNPLRACVADHWSFYKRIGINIKAIYPYVIDANIGGFESDIRQSHFGEIKRNMTISNRIPAYWLSGIKKALVKVGHFVPKIRK